MRRGKAGSVRRRRTVSARRFRQGHGTGYQDNIAPEGEAYHRDPPAGGLRGLCGRRLRAGLHSGQGAPGLGHHHLRPAGAGEGPFPQDDRHRTCARHGHRHASGGGLRGDHLPDRRGLRGQQASQPGDLYRGAGGGPAPQGSDHQCHGLQRRGRAGGSLRRHGGPGGRGGALRGGSTGALPGGRTAHPAGHPLCRPAGIRHRAGDGGSHGRACALFMQDQRGADPGGAGKASGVAPSGFPADRL